MLNKNFEHSKIKVATNPPDLMIVEDGFILPHRKDHTVWGIGGVLDGNQNYIPVSGYDGWFPFGGKYEFDSDSVIYQDEEVIWFGIFTYHWGHFLVDNVSRMWYVLKNTNHKIAYVPKSKDMDSNFIEFFKALGINEDRLIPIRIPTKFKTIFIPEYSKSDYSYSDDFTHIFDKIVKTILSNDKIVNDAVPKKIYLSRLSFKDAKSKEYGEERIEKFFLNNGYSIYYPEKMSLLEQVRMWNTCETIACINGTIPLNICFCRNKNIELIVLNKSSIPHTNLFDFQKIFDLPNIVYFDCFSNKYDRYVKSLGNGPFILKLTKEMQLYVLNNKKNVFENETIIYKAKEFCFFVKRLCSLMMIKLIKSYLRVISNIRR
ncbi:glycosyltransferase family 61 protein [Klebsiella variicola]|uniref:glycosyltransferase family 61 protein n=1 Tax=Klebsiella variicola TaxID=244366 RepID=UPI0007CCC7E0|nr:glycosyltransferase 61 family protein [Klebsiella variicola]SBI13253.1 Capsular polysaccharide biosynthesis protein [Klebsiella variicola]